MSGHGSYGARPCDPDCTLRDWPHDGPCQVQQYIEAPAPAPVDKDRSGDR